MIYDITPLISQRLKVWPGDTPPTREVLCDLKQGANITLSTLRSTVHLGAHADAPSHYGANGPAIHERSLEYYLGPCQLIRVAAAPARSLRPEDVRGMVVSPRLLIDTGSYPDAERFTEDFASLTPELVDWLHERGVILIGLDSPSVDPFSSKDLPAHHAFLRHDMAILEGLMLKSVPEGLYELIALPLKLEGFDASPVRAVLRPFGGSVAARPE
jgi:arylformamidase